MVKDRVRVWVNIMLRARFIARPRASARFKTRGKG
jgi:hypothetical protein